MNHSLGTYNTKSVMHPSPHTIQPQQSLREARDLMHKYTIRHLPVMEDGQLCGILSERDINSALRFDHKSADQLTVRDAFNDHAYVVDVETPLFNIAGTMAKEHYGCALITEKGKLAGIFTTVDACRILHEILAEKLDQ